MKPVKRKVRDQVWDQVSGQVREDIQIKNVSGPV